MSKQLTTADLAHSKKLDSVTSVELQPADIMVADNTVGGVDKSEEEKIELAFKDKERQEDGEVEMAVSDSKAPSPIEGPSNVDIEPRKWKWAVIFLCFYGFMSSIKPGEPFITPYLLSPEKNFTKKQVTNEITPVLTYSNMAVLVPAFLLTDLLRYKPVLVIQGISQVVIWVILLLGTTLLEMQFMEFFYGIHMACRVAYSSYIFSLVSPVLYQRVAGYSRSSVLLGVFSSSALGQLCMSLGNISFFNLSAISLGFVSFSLLLSLFLPWPKRSLFFNRTQDKEQNKQAAEASKSELDKIKPKETQATSVSSMSSWKKSVFVQMLLEVRDVVKKPDLRLWSLWWVLNSTGYYLVLYYVHILWNEVYPATVYNGGVEAASTLLSALTAFIAGFVKIRWNVWSELVIGIVTAVQAGLLLLMATTHNIWVCYISYVIFRGSHQFLVPVASFRIASSLSKELCALVFGINTFLGTVLTSIISLIISDKRVLSLDVRTQFLLYLSYFIILTVIYLVTAAVVIIRQYRNQQRTRRGAQDQAASTELRHVAVNSEIELLSNSKSVVA